MDDELDISSLAHQIVPSVYKFRAYEEIYADVPGYLSCLLVDSHTMKHQVLPLEEKLRAYDEVRVEAAGELVASLLLPHITCLSIILSCFFELCSMKFKARCRVNTTNL